MMPVRIYHLPKYDTRCHVVDFTMLHHLSARQLYSLLTPMSKEQAADHGMFACAGDAATVHTAAWPLLQDLLIDCQHLPLSLHISSSHTLDKLAVRAKRLHIAPASLPDLQRVRSLALWWRDADEGCQEVAQAAQLHGPTEVEDGERMR